MLEEDQVVSHLEAEGIDEAYGPERLLTDGGESLGDADDDDGRLSRLRDGISSTYERAAEAAPENPLVWLGATGAGGWTVYQTEDEAWDSISREFPEYLDEAVKDTALAADYAGDAAANGAMAGFNFVEAGIVATIALGTVGAAGKTVQTYRRRNREE